MPKVEAWKHANEMTHMSYMQEVDLWLEKLLRSVVDDETRAAAKELIKAKLLDSYHNGVNAKSSQQAFPSRKPYRR